MPLQKPNTDSVLADHRIPNPALFSFKDRFHLADLFREQEKHAEEVDAFIRKQEDGTWIGLDLRELDFLGYSYSKPTIRRPIMRQISGEYDQKRIFIVADQDESFFDGLERALLDKKLAALLASHPSEPITEWKILGKLSDHLHQTFDRLIEVGPISTSDFAKKIDQSVPNTNARLRDLQSLGLIQRYESTSPSGGREWVNKVA